MRKFFRKLFTAADTNKIEVMYFGRASEFLMMTSERIEVSDEVSTLEKMLNSLRLRSETWAYELDREHVFCTINRKAAQWSTPLNAGDEVGIFSNRSLFAPM
ncbi:MAG: MoaD/ThiS family protein [Gallionella sp.]|nr:MoaD/ThiS family protein [Gallionella sp.]MDD4946049.1 MoaD/ThiS family protein [Gallionella sp.]